MSTVTFPEKYLRTDAGTLVLKIHTGAALNRTSLLVSGNAELAYQNKQIRLKIGNQTLTLPITIGAGYTTFLWTWEGARHQLVCQHVDTTITQTQDTMLFEPGLINLKNNPLFTEDFVLLETHVTSLVGVSLTDLKNQVHTYQSRLTHSLNEGAPQSQNHAFSELLPIGGRTFGRDFRQSNIFYTQKPYLEATPAPIDQSPILVSDEEGPLNRTYFFNPDTTEYTNTNTETFVLGNEIRFQLAYDHLDLNYPVIVDIDGETFTNYQLIGNEVLLWLEPWEHQLHYGKSVDITYKLSRSYHIEWNEQAAHDSYIIQLSDEDQRPITVTQEGNRFNNQKLATEIELNPILNPQHTGFMYIDTEQQQGQAFRLSVSSDYLMMDGLDSADFVVELIDQHGNEVLSPFIDVFVADKYNARQTKYGQLVPIITEDTLHARNAAGRCYFRYRAPLLDNQLSYKDELFLVAYDRATGLGAQVPIRLRMPFFSEQSSLQLQYAQEGIPEAIVPFEYFARFYNRPLPDNHPLHQLDSDKDGILTRTDWLVFVQNIHQQGLLFTLTHDLLAQETILEGVD